jgi:hypothetical protein
MTSWYICKQRGDNIKTCLGERNLIFSFTDFLGEIWGRRRGKKKKNCYCLSILVDILCYKWLLISKVTLYDVFADSTLNGKFKTCFDWTWKFRNLEIMKKFPFFFQNGKKSLGGSIKLIIKFLSSTAIKLAYSTRIGSDTVLHIYSPGVKQMKHMLNSINFYYLDTVPRIGTKSVYITHIWNYPKLF